MHKVIWQSASRLCRNLTCRDRKQSGLCRAWIGTVILSIDRIVTLAYCMCLASESVDLTRLELTLFSGQLFASPFMVSKHVVNSYTPCRTRSLK